MYIKKARIDIRVEQKLKLFLPSIIASVFLIILGQILVPGFASIKNLSSILMTTGLVGLAAMAQNTAVMAGNNGIDLSIGAIASATAVICPALMFSDTIPALLFAFLVAAFIGMAFGTVNGIGIQKFRIPPIIMTLIMASVINGAKLKLTRGSPATKISLTLQSLSSVVIQPFRILTICAIIIIILGEIMLKTKHGRALLLTGDNPNAANICGINTRLVSYCAYTISGGLAGIMGLFLVGYAGSTTMSMGDSYTMLSIAAVAIGGTDLSGGKGSYLSCLLGAFVLTVLTTILQALNIHEGIRYVIKGVVLVIIMAINIISNRTKD